MGGLGRFQEFGNLEVEARQCIEAYGCRQQCHSTNAKMSKNLRACADQPVVLGLWWWRTAIQKLVNVGKKLIR